MSSETVITKNIGRVKWFNNKSGYGFITFMTNNNLKGSDIFVHHSSIASKQNLYKYLVQGEYVEFNVEKMENKDNKEHENQATGITGILGGELMCETRFKNKETLTKK
jgi:cold shock CspA family protein